IAPGQLAGSITVPVIGDTLYEGNETFTVSLSNVSGATLARAQGTGTIIDDDAPVSLSIADASTHEGNSGTTLLTFTVSLSGPSGNPVSVYFQTTDGTATAGTPLGGNDYQATSGSLSFAPDQTTRTFTVLIFGDITYEPNETFYAMLYGA